MSMHPRHVIDQVIPDRTSEIAALREQLLRTEVSAAYWKSNAEQRALDIGRLVRQRDEAREERDRARALAQRLAEQSPLWQDGPA